jgi:signal transduction histidine kinase
VSRLTPPSAASVEEFTTAVGRAAHDLNNLCASILGFTTLTQESLPADSPLRVYLEEVQASAHKTVALADRLRDLAHAAKR